MPARASCTQFNYFLKKLIRMRYLFPLSQNDLETLDVISGEFTNQIDPSALKKLAELFVENQQYAKAVELLASAGKVNFVRHDNQHLIFKKIGIRRCNFMLGTLSTIDRRTC